MSIIGSGGELAVAMEVWMAVVTLIATVAALAIFIRSGAFRPSSIPGPPRLPPDEPVGPILFIMIGGVSLWLFVPVVILKLMHRGVPIGDIEPTPKETVILSIVGGAVPLFFMLLGTITRRQRGLETLGFAWWHLKRAIGPAIAGTVFVIPVIGWVAVFAQWLMEKLGLEYPSKHELLEIMDAAPSRLLKVLIVFGAVAVAPLFEEFLFRGHLQTLIVRIFGAGSRAYGFPMVTSTGETVPVPEAARGGLPEPLVRWIAVVLASLLFALVHHWAFWLPIFTLSICLGYMYERTANLWVPVLMHAMFNGTSIVGSYFLPH